VPPIQKSRPGGITTVIVILLTHETESKRITVVLSVHTSDCERFRALLRVMR